MMLIHVNQQVNKIKSTYELSNEEIMFQQVNQFDRRKIWAWSQNESYFSIGKK